MKTVVLFLITIVSYLNLQAEIIESAIKQVVVYRQGAKITGFAQASLLSGNNEVVLGNLTTAVDPNSIQVSTKGNATLLSVSFRTNFLTPATLPKRIKELEDSLKIVTDRIEWIKNEQAIYQGEENLIIENQKIVNEKEKITVAELAQLADFYRNRLTSIRKKTFENAIEIRNQSEKKENINKQLNELQRNRGKNTGEIVLNIAADQPSKIMVNFSFISNNAGWSPLYDLRCADINNPIDLVYKANVFQNTGYDWQGIDLAISTGNPSVNNDRPILNPWYIDYYVEMPPVVGYGTMKRAQGIATSNLMMADEEIAEEKVESSVPYEVAVASGQMAHEYQIKIKQDIPSDGKKHIVPISEFELPATYIYHSVPKLDQHAFLLARVGGYGQYNLLPGQTNIFFEGMYVGQSYLNPEVTIDSLLISMGRDDRISVSRNILKDLTSKQSIGPNKKEVKGYEIVLRNNKNQPVNIEILDQVPISMNKDISVEIEEMSGAKYTADYGKLLWKIDLTPGETKKIRFVYSVKYPKDKQISGL